jgi:DNA-binding NarL/FixJ family response regulator
MRVIRIEAIRLLLVSGLLCVMFMPLHWAKVQAMSRHWVLPPRPAAHPLPLVQVTALLAQLGLSGRHAVAETLLGMLGAHVALAQCTLFSHEPGRKPAVLAVGDRARTRELPHITQAYLSRYHLLDTSHEAMRQEAEAARRADPSHPHIVLHRQTGADIAHAGYRRTCYELPQVAERLSILSLHEGRRWLSVNLYRGVEHGVFSQADIATVEAFAPLVVHAVRLHHTGQALAQGLPEMLVARLAQRHPGLTQRDQDVVLALLQGCSAQMLATRLGLTLASARTYPQRVYRKLGLSGRSGLWALLMAPDLPPMP